MDDPSESDKVATGNSDRSDISPLSSFDLETEPRASTKSSESFSSEENYSVDLEVKPIDTEPTLGDSDLRITPLDPDEDIVLPFDRQDVISRLNILREHGHTIEFTNEISLEELLKIYEAKLGEMQKKNEEETQRAQLGMVLLFIEQEGIIPPGEVVRMMQPEVPLQEIVNLINKHANQIKQGLQQMQTRWNNML